MESPNGEKLTKKSDVSDRDHSQIHVISDPNPAPNRKPDLAPVETDNVEIVDEQLSSTTTPAGHSPVNRSKKSVRWSIDLVEERTLPPLEKNDDDHNYESSNPYVNRSRESNNPPAFNING